MQGMPARRMSGGRQHTTRPIVTGTSVIGIKYNGGVMMMADTLGSYGSLARFPDLCRFHQAGSHCCVGFGGEYSDMQYLQRTLDNLMLEDFMAEDGREKNCHEVYSYLSRLLHHRRSNVNPLYNQLVVGGFHDNEPLLGYVDLYGSCYKDNTIATGFGMYLAIPILREAYSEDMTEEGAREVLETCMRVLFYRDGRTINRYQRTTVDKDGVRVSEPYSLETEWNYERFVNPQQTALHP